MAEHPLKNLDIMTSNEITNSIPYSPNHIRRLEDAGIFPNVSALEETALHGSGMKSKIGCCKGSRNGMPPFI